MNKDFETLVNQMSLDEMYDASIYLQKMQEERRASKQQAALDKIIDAFKDYYKEYGELYIVTPCDAYPNALDNLWTDSTKGFTTSIKDGIAEICFS